jgi:hypothetical protein
MLGMLANKHTLGIGLLIAVLAGGGGAAQAQTKLAYHFKEGEKFTYGREEKATLRMNVSGKITNFQIMRKLDISWHVTAVDKDGKARIEQKMDRVRFSLDTAKGKMTFDSRDPKASEGAIGQTIGPLLKALAEAQISLSVDGRGQMSELTLPESFLKALKKLPANLPGVNEMFSEENLKEMLADSVLLLPGEALQKGTSWTEKRVATFPQGKKTVTIVYTYEGDLKRGDQTLHEVSFKTSFTFQPAKDSPINLKHKDGKGTVLFDSTAGRLVEKSFTQVRDEDFTIGGQTHTQQVQESVTVKLGKTK